MKLKLESVRVNLITLLRKIDQIEASEEINYELIKKVGVINNKLCEVEELIEEMEAVEEF